MQPQPAQQDQLMQLRTNTIEQYAQVNSEIDMLNIRRSALKKRARLLLEDLRGVTGQINQLQQEAAKSQPIGNKEVQDGPSPEVG